MAIICLEQFKLKKYLSYKFSGRVDAVSYDIKGFPNVTVNNKRYCLSAGYNFNYKIELGDTLKKRRGSNIYTLIKHKNGEILIFDN